MTRNNRNKHSFKNKSEHFQSSFVRAWAQDLNRIDLKIGFYVKNQPRKRKDKSGMQTWSTNTNNICFCVIKVCLNTITGLIDANFTTPSFYAQTSIVVALIVVNLFSFFKLYSRRFPSFLTIIGHKIVLFFL